jgi:hypothetical protein
MWRAEALVNGQWVTRAECGSKFVASLALTRDELYAGRQTRLTKNRTFAQTSGHPIKERSMKNTFPLALVLARDCTAEQVARWCGMSASWADGVLDAIEGERKTRPWSMPEDLTAEERADHLAGFDRGNDLRTLVEQAQGVLVAGLFQATMADLSVPQSRKRVLRNQLRRLVVATGRHGAKTIDEVEMQAA